MSLIKKKTTSFSVEKLFPEERSNGREQLKEREQAIKNYY